MVYVRGRVINIGSSHGIVVHEGQGRTLRDQGGDHQPHASHCRGVRVPEGIVANTLSPGRILTGPLDDDPRTPRTNVPTRNR